MAYDPIFTPEHLWEASNASTIKKNRLKRNMVYFLFRHGENTIPEISKATQVSIPTATKAILELMQESIIIDHGMGESSGGRRPSIYGLNPLSRYILSVDLSRFKTRMVFLDIRGNQVTAEVEHISDLEHDPNIIKLVGQWAFDLIKSSNIDQRKIVAAGIAFPGLINNTTGISQSYPSLGDKPLSQMFSEVLGFRTFVENDARIMAYGEHLFGAAQGKSNALCLNIGPGIGMGMILNDRLYRGNSGYAGEFGHIEVEQDGQLCICGKRGCLETIASGNAVSILAQQDIMSGVVSMLTELSKGNPAQITPAMIIEAAKSGDQYAIGLLTKTGEQLGKGISILINIFNPEIIVLGGELADADHFISDPIQVVLKKYTISKIRNDAQLVSSFLGTKATLLGSFGLVVDKIFETDNEKPFLGVA